MVFHFLKCPTLILIMNFINTIIPAREDKMENVCCETAANISEKTVTMAMLEPGSRGMIKSFILNCEDSHSCRFVRRLKEIGLHMGAHFEILKNSGNGEISVVCEGSTIALGRGMADKITVELSNGSIMEGSIFGRFCRKFGIKCRP